MTSLRPDPGSFRDPGGRVFINEDHVLRAVLPANAPAYQAARAVGLYENLIKQNLLLPAQDVPLEQLGAHAGAAVHVLRHPRIPFISYPYEWSFSSHRRAALLHLDLHLQALEQNFTLSDATAYNVQFQGTQPIFIDHLSLHPYRDGELWAGHRQFCMQFLNPLLFWSIFGLSPNEWFRGSLEGIAPEALLPLLPLRRKFSWTVMTHVVAQGLLQRRAIGQEQMPGRVRSGRLPRQSFIGLLSGLRNYIARMCPPQNETVWADYAGANSYSGEEAQVKRAFVRQMVATLKPDLVFDIGCNTGDYSEAALEAGAKYVVGFDYDHAALDYAYERFDKTAQPFLPLHLDAANPSPSQGWAQRERQGLSERSPANALIALALIHHIVIGRNIPLHMALDWLLSLAPEGIIEFPQKNDPMVQRLLAHRKDIFPDYEESAFLAALEERARIVASKKLAENGRLLVWYRRSS